ncbi:MAG: T9SS type A sorting domain-containing protein [Chitinophagales bacterium]
MKIISAILFVVLSCSLYAQTNNQKILVSPGGNVKTTSNISHICAVGEFAVSSVNTGFFTGTIGYLDKEDSISFVITGIKNSVKPESVYSIYPNPANSILTLNFKDVKEKTMINIYDVNGKIIWQQPSKVFTIGEILTIDLSDKGAGLYFIELNTDEESFFQKFILCR